MIVDCESDDDTLLMAQSIDTGIVTAFRALGYL
jgi:hypothetical protein